MNRLSISFTSFGFIWLASLLAAGLVTLQTSQAISEVSPGVATAMGDTFDDENAHRAASPRQGSNGSAVESRALQQMALGDGPYHIDWSPDGRTFLSVGDRGTFLWDVETGEVLRSLVGHTLPVTSAAYSPDGTRVVSGAYDRTAIIWDARTGSEVRRLGHVDGLVDVAFSPDSRFVLTGSVDGTARLWDAASGAAIRVFSGHTDSVNSVAFSPDGSRVLTGSSDNTARLWNTATGNLVRVFSEHTDDVNAVAFSPDGSRIVTASHDFTAIIWNPDTGGIVHQLVGHTLWIWDVAFSPDGTMVATASSDSVTRLWDANSGEVLRTFYGQYKGTNSVAFSPDSSRIAIGSWDNLIKIWDVSSGALIEGLEMDRELQVIGNMGSGTDSQGRFAFALDNSNAQGVEGGPPWETEGNPQDVETGFEISIPLTDLGVEPGDELRLTALIANFEGTYLSNQFLPPLPTPGENLAFLPSLADAQIGFVSYTIADHGAGEPPAITLDGRRSPEEQWGDLLSVQTVNTGFGKNNGMLFGGGGSQLDNLSIQNDDTHLHLFLGGNLEGNGNILTLLFDAVHLSEHHTGAFAGVGELLGPTVFPEGMTVTSIYSVKTYQVAGAPLWRWGHARLFGPELNSLRAHADSVLAVNFSPDGTMAVTAGREDTARVWNPVTGHPIRTFIADPGNSTTAVVFTPDGTELVGANYAGRIRVWNVATGETRLLLVAHPQPILDTVVSRDGQVMLSGGMDGTARLWDMATGEELRTLSVSSSEVTSVDLSPDASRAIIGTFFEARIIELASGQELHSLTAHQDWVQTVAFSPDGSRVLTGGNDNTARVWNADTGAEIHALSGHAQPVQSAAFSPDGMQILTGSGDRTAKLWDANTGEELRTFEGHVGAVMSVAFSPDGRRILTGSYDGATLLWELNPPRAIIVAGSGPYPGNPIAQQTQDLAAYSYRTLRARGYTHEDLLFLSAFGTGLDATGDGLPDVDAEMSLAALEEAITGEFGSGAGRLLIILLGHGHRTGSFMTYRATPSELLPTSMMTEWLDTLQDIAPVEVTVLADFCYSGQLAIDAALDDSADPSAPGRTIIASTSPTAEAVFLPPPDMTSFTYTFLSSAYMGNSFGESFRAGERFFSSFPVANQIPRMDARSLASGETDERFFGASWIYGIQSTRDINDFFPVFEEVSPERTILPGTSVDLYARLLPNQAANSVVAIVRPPAPTVQAGEPVVALPRVEMTQDPDDPLLWEATVPAELFTDSGTYTVSFTARLPSQRVSNPEFTRVLLSEGLDPDATVIRAIIAVAEADDPELRDTVLRLGSWGYSVILERHRNAQGQPISGAVEWVSPRLPLFARKNGALRPREFRALETYERQTQSRNFGDDLLAAIAGQDADAGRLYIHIVSDDARDGVLRLSDGRSVSATDLDAALDDLQARAAQPEVIVVIDAPGSGSFYEPLLPTGNQMRLVITSGRAADGAVFLPSPLLTSFTQRFLTRAWQGSDLLESLQGARNFFEDFLAYYPDPGRISPRINNTVMARTQWLGRRWAFGAEAELPFILAVAPDATLELGMTAELWIDLLEGVEPVDVYAQLVPPGLDIGGLPLTDLPRIPLSRVGASWRWSGPVAPDQAGTYRVAYWAEYADAEDTRLTQPGFAALEVTGGVTDEFDGTGWMLR